MQYGFVFPGGTARQQLDLAELAEASGWDGVFTWETSFGLDPWSLLAAMAVRTSRVRLGTLLTPLPWRRPWKVASQLATVDELSGGRAILSVGLGAADPALGHTGEPTDRKLRAELLDEGLDVIDALLGGERRTTGRHYAVDFSETSLLAAPPTRRPTVWIAGLWGAPRSMRRVLRGDGYLPNLAGGPGMEVGPHVAEMRRWLDANARDGRRLDLITEGQTPDHDPAAAAAQVAPLAEAGATWWIENRWGPDMHGDGVLAGVRRRLEAGPPRPH
jgi:alkanesulfonate monooxygenase SsuD/methylene tetrahydromethanopterin reductase-like flavin-dependent oxidoreductase (luciferase family)